MTSTGNQILDQTIRNIARAKAAQEAQDRKQSGESKRAAARSKSKGGGGRSRGALRSAGKSKGGRGIVVKSNKSGRGFAGVVQYATDPAKTPQYIGVNDGLAAMISAASQRPDIKNPVGHITLSLPPSTGRIEPSKWEQLVTELRSQIGLNDSFPTMVVRHEDTDHDHVHLIFSRVSIDSKVHDQSNIGLRCMSAERVLEHRFDLPLVPTSRAAASLKKGEIEKALRTGQMPARIEIQRSLDSALLDRPSLSIFIERLQIAGITATPNIAESGKMSGFSFSRDGVAFKASQIGKQYGWQSLSERLSEDFIHEQTRSNRAAPEHSESASQRSQDNARTVEQLARIDHKHSAPAIDRTGGAPAKTPAKATAKPGQRPSTAGAPSGFAKSETLDIGMRGWVDGIANRILVKPLPVASKAAGNGFEAYTDSRGRVVAIKLGNGWAIPETKQLTADQIAGLLETLEAGQTIEIEGNPLLVGKVRAIAEQRGLCAPSSSPDDAPERPNEGAIEWGEVQAVDLESSQPAPF